MHASPLPAPRFQFSHDWVIYQDEAILVVNKPSGLLSVPGRGADKYECLAFHLQPEFGELFIVHRLDMDTSGLMVIARNKESHRILSRQFQERQTSKTYHAICFGQPSQNHGKVQLPMRCDWDKRPLQMIDFKQGKAATTQWRVIAQANHVTQGKQTCTMELKPITGRSHQLRLHMKSLGHPILGDNLYADSHTLKLATRLMLHASSLSFSHPISEDWLNFNCPANF